MTECLAELTTLKPRFLRLFKNLKKTKIPTFVFFVSKNSKFPQSHRALKSREISRVNTGIFAHMWHQRSLLGMNQSRPLTLNDHWRSKAIKVA